jgi:hypothetical protein
MQLNRKINLLLSLTLILIIASCSPGKETSREGSRSTEISWNNSLSLDVASEFVSQLVITGNNYSRPVFLVGKIGAEGVTPDICSGLEYDIELALVNTGKASFIHDNKKLQNERYNRKNMSDFETVSEINNYMNKHNVDYFIEGRVKKSDNGIETSYVISLRSFNINTGESSEWQKVITSN